MSTADSAPGVSEYRRGEQSIELSPPAEQIARRGEGTREELLTLNFGPHHPATHGVLRLLVHLDGEAGDVLLLDPALGQGDGLMHVSVRSPLGIEEGRLVGDGDVTLKSRDDRRTPDVVDTLRDLFGIHRTAENSIPRGLEAVRKKELRRN